jgi:uncharacterized membrane protein
MMFFGGGMFLFWLLVIGVVAAALGGLSIFAARPRTENGGGALQSPASQTPEAILQTRYVRGEISREEYQQMQETLKSS